MEWSVNRNAQKPLYQQIYEMIEEKISYGEFPPGSLLPSERKLAQQLEVNRMTVSHVYDELQAAGLVDRKKGSGTRVSAHKWGILPKGVTNWRKYIESGPFIPTYPLIKKVREEAKKMKGGFNLATGELPTDLTPTKLLEKSFTNKILSEDFGNMNPQGHQAFRESLSEFVKNYHGIQTAGSSILITSGAQQALYLITQCLLSPGDAVAIEAPSYSYSLPLFQSAGLRIFGLPVDEKGINPDDIAKLYENHQIRMIFLNPTFQSPTGTVLSDERRRKILEVTSQLGIPIVEDDPVSLLALEGEKQQPLKSLDRSGNVLYIGSLSKVIASNLRVGWIIGPQSVIDRLADARQQIDFGLSIFPQLVAKEILISSEYPRHLTFLKEELLARRNKVMAVLKEQLEDRITFIPPNGGLFIWCKINQKIDDYKLVEEGIKRKILFMPGSVYGAPNGYVRINFSRLPVHKAKEAISLFSNAISSL